MGVGFVTWVSGNLERSGKCQGAKAKDPPPKMKTYTKTKKGRTATVKRGE